MAELSERPGIKRHELVQSPGELRSKMRQGMRMSSRSFILVFHLDDSHEQLEVAKIILEKDDPSIKVNPFQSPSALIRELTVRNCDCIVTSYNVNRMNIELLAPEIRRVTEAPIILYSALERYNAEQIVSSNHIDGFVEKKSNLEHYKELTAMIRGVVEKYRRIRSS